MRGSAVTTGPVGFVQSVNGVPRQPGRNRDRFEQSRPPRTIPLPMGEGTPLQHPRRNSFILGPVDIHRKAIIELAR